MKNLATILALVFAFIFTTQAQKKRNEEMPKLTTEQRTNLAIKKMTLSLDLSEKQQTQLKPILETQIAEKKAAFETRKEARKNKELLTADQMYAFKSKQLDNQIAMKNKMKNILNKEQFEKFEKMQQQRKMMDLKGLQKRMPKKHTDFEEIK